MEITVNKLKLVIFFVIIFILFSGCSGNYMHVTQVASEEILLPEQIHKRPLRNYFTTSKVGIFRFAEPVNYTDVGYTAAYALYQKLIHSNTFYEVVPELHRKGLRLDAQFEMARREKLDLIIVGRVLYYVAGTPYQESRVEEELAIYCVKTKKLIWFATAEGIGKPVPETDYFIFKIMGEDPTSPTQLFRNNAQKFINMLDWVSPHYETLSDDMKLIDIGFNHMANENYGKAKHCFNKALKINPDNPYAYLNLGVVYESQGNIEKAANMYQKVIELNPTQIITESNKPGAIGRSLTDTAKNNLSALPM